MGTDGLEGLCIPGFERIVVDSHTGLKELTSDMSRGRLDLNQYQLIMLNNAQADFLRNDDMQVVLERLLSVIAQQHSEQKVPTPVWVTGPMARRHDREGICAALERDSKRMFNFLQGKHTVQYVLLSELFYSDRGAIQSMFNDAGALSWNGIREFKAICQTL